MFRSHSLMWEPICTPGKPSSFTQRSISLTASSGACMGNVPRPTNLLGWLATVAARSLFKSWHRSKVSCGLAWWRQVRENYIIQNLLLLLQNLYSEQHLPGAKSFVTLGGFTPQKAEAQIEIGLGHRRPRSQSVQVQRKLPGLLIN